jgi:hypothetical protein
VVTTYPGTADTFNVPSSPTTTPLSSAGTGTRNHVSHHRDLGDAVMAIQNNVTQITHTHDSTGLNGPKLDQANTHQNVDTDVAANSLHHTLGIGATQAAAGSHLHDTSYVRLDNNIDQTITGKKIFPVGTKAINILDFQNSQHSHTDIANGGPAYPAAGVTGQINHGGNGSPVYGGTTEDMWLHTNRFTIPPFIALAGHVNIHYYAEINNSAQGAQQHPDYYHNVFFYISMNQGESPAFSYSKSILQNGGNFNGPMCQSNFLFNQNGLQEGKRFNIFLPIYISASTLTRPNVTLVMRVANTSNGWMKELNWSINFQFVSQNFFTL